jgi:O-antigen ligase
MASVLLAIYIALFLIRPMDWWGPLLGVELVTFAAIALFFVGLPTILPRLPRVWKDVPQLKMGLLFLLGTILSWASKFWFGGALTAFQSIGKLIFFFGLIILLVNTRQDYRLLLWTFLGCAVWMAIHAMLQQHQGYGFGGKPPLWRVRNRQTGEGVQQAIAFGTFEDPNDLCLVFVTSIPLFYTQYKTISNPIWKAISLAGLASVAYGAYCTNSRGGVVGAFGMVVAYTVARTKGIRRYLIAAVAVSLVTIVAPSRFGAGMADRGRAVVWGDGLAMFKSNPLFGIGYGDFTTYSEEHLVAHNTYIHTLAELGLAGYLPLFLIIYLTMAQLRRTINQKQNISPQDQTLLTGIFAALSGYLTGMYFISRQYQHILYFILSLSIIAVYIICSERNLREVVFGQIKKDLRNGLLWGLGSIAVMWVTVRLANMMS